ncbi:Fc receptor-like protein 5 [Polypterus senegalus]|uniref:Fc receptor-like protein 5 n=1 Tax=Polypterus senegalus TaxID=55291 RepID=UPI0019668739|nr:Fc receptor-like protein 5 [Polypterus senegalus]
MTTQEKLFHFGDTVNLECRIKSGLPNWTFRWFFGNQTEKGKQIEGETEDNYNIPYVTELDSGVYRCDAYVADSYNSSQTSNVITLRIQERPNAILILRNQTNLISIGDTVTLDCSIDGGFTGWQYRWYKFGSNNDWEKFIESSGSTYTIKSISHADNGEYLCDAINETPPCGSQASNTITVNVKDVGGEYVIS